MLKGLHLRLVNGGDLLIKGYIVPNGYMGFVNGKYILFATEADYLEYMKEEN